MSADTWRRVVRTAFQVGTISAILAVLTAFGVPFSEEQQKAILGLGTIIVAVVHNAIEDATGRDVLR